MSKSKRRQTNRHSQIETLESREVMSADPLGGLLGGAISQHGFQEEVQQQVAMEAPGISHHGVPELELHGVPELDHHTLPAPDFWLDDQPVISVEEQLEQIEKSLSSAHQLTGLDQVRANYGFSGVGQTVAVIDSGIAYDHYALGGGKGSGYRVVGGWDFTENDADFYDDGTEGSHGTHVAGIVGASDGSRSGVATGVDLVGLRVFSDTGAGYFSWVESALQWVHTNRNNFENPITAINLSLGTNWNASSIPAWAMLEDEFAQLKADGIFIAVSAGNSYSSFNTPGLSYPAASQHVVPVMSSDDSGFLSYFSQRHQRAIAAPGRYIYSTVPDYAGNHNGVTDDWANFSGTSMAAPYVAGSSVIIREAMEFVGMTNITQDTIYNHMIATADTFTDAASGATYNRLNMKSALDALMPEDDFGSSVADAYSLGTIFAGPQTAAAPMSGHIAKLGDADYFTFTAGATGAVTFSAANTTHHMSAAWQGMGGEGWTGDGGHSYTMNVVAGNQYTVALSSSDGLGYYDLAITAESTFSYTDWGVATTQQTRQGITVGAETYYRLQAGQSGYLTVESLTGTGAVNLGLYDANLGLVDAGSGGRVDYYASAGEELYLQVSGSASEVDFRITNAVSAEGGVVSVEGTAGDDAFAFIAGATHSVSVNGVGYSFASASHSTFNFAGRLGNDTITVTGTSADETAHIHSNSLDFTGGGTTVSASGVEGKVVNSGGGVGDIAYFYDTYGDESYDAYADRAVMLGTGFRSEAVGFARTWTYASLGDDTATLHDGATDDRLVAGKYYALMVSVSGEFFNYVTGFDDVIAQSNAGGQDYATLHGSAGNEEFIGTQAQSSMTYGSEDLSNTVMGFDAVFAYGNGGTDIANLYDAATDDLMIAADTWAVLQDKAGSYSNYAAGFSRVDAYADGGGDDTAYLYDGAGDDHFEAGSNYGFITADDGSFYNYATGFDSVYAIANYGGGDDRATLHDSSGDDTVVAHPSYMVMQNANATYFNYASGFESTYAYSTHGGNDKANLYGGATNDLFTAAPDHATLSDTAGTFANYVEGFADVSAYGGGGNDQAELYDGVTNDRFVAGPNWGLMLSTTGEFSNYASGFRQVTGLSTAGGQDFATFYDSVGNDRFSGGFASSAMEDLAGTYRNVGYGFEQVYAYASGGADTAVLRDSAADDLLFGRDGYAYLQGGGRLQCASGFDTVLGESLEGGADTADIDSIDYVFDQIGGWA